MKTNDFNLKRIISLLDLLNKELTAVNLPEILDGLENNQQSREREFSYEAQTFYLYNKTSNIGRLGYLTANKDGACLANPKFPLHIALGNDDHEYDFNFLKGKNGDPTIESAQDRWFRIGGVDGLALWGDGKHRENDVPNICISSEGKIGINTTMEEFSTQEISNYDLFVPQSIYASNYGLMPSKNWVSNIFKDDYKLGDLSELKKFIKKNRHLPNMSSAEISEQGYDLHEMNMKLLEKIEELTLYFIEQESKVKSLEKRIEDIEMK